MIHPLSATPMWKLRKETMERIKFFETSGYAVKYIWEHEFEDMKKANNDLKNIDLKVRLFSTIIVTFLKSLKQILYGMYLFF